jgi:hypothetical protein
MSDLLRGAAESVLAVQLPLLQWRLLTARFTTQEIARQHVSLVKLGSTEISRIVRISIRRICASGKWLKLKW